MERPGMRREWGDWLWPAVYFVVYFGIAAVFVIAVSKTGCPMRPSTG